MPLATYAALIQSYAPVARWQLGEATGSLTVADSSGNGWTGTVHGGVTLGQQQPFAGGPTSAEFNGSSGYISTSLNPDDWTGGTLVAWVNLSAAPSGDIARCVGNIAGAGSEGMELSIEPTTLPFFGVQLGGTDYTVAGNAVGTGSWVMLVGTWASGLQTLYVNGSKVNSAVVSGSFGMGAAGLQIGGGGTYNGETTWLDGYLAEVAVFNFALSATQIATLWTASQPAPTPQPSAAQIASTLDSKYPLTYRLYSLFTGAYLGNLPLNQVTFSSQLNQPGQLSGTVDVYDPRIQSLDPYTISRPGYSCLVVDYAGTIVWAGAVLGRNDDWDGTPQCKLTVNASELWSYLQLRVQATDYSSPPYSGITGPSMTMPIWDATGTSATGVYDPVLIAWQIISDALTQVYFGDQIGNILGGLNIAANSYTTAAAYLGSNTGANSGDYIAVNYPYSSPQQVSTVIGQLMANGLNVGFDGAIDLAYGGQPGSPPIGTVNLSYPRRGQTYAQKGLVLNAAQALSMSIPEDATQAGNTIYEEGQSGSLVVSQNITPSIQGWPLLEQIISHASIQSANVLNVLTALGLSDLYQRSYPVVTPTVTLDLFNTTLPLGSFIVGDDVMWVIPATDGSGSTAPYHPRFPSGYASAWRIVGYSATVSDDGESSIQYSLALPPALTTTAPPF